MSSNSYFSLDPPMEKQEIQLEDKSKERAKKIKEEGNAHYKKKELDMAIAKYDEVILKNNGHKMNTEKLSKNSQKICPKMK